MLLPWFIRITYGFFRGAGAGLIAFSILTIFFSFGPIITQEISYDLKEFRNIKQDESKNTDSNLNLKIAEADEILAVQKEAQTYGVNSYFSVVIPKIDAASNIIANVDVSDKNSYLDALQNGVAHAKGTHFPGQEGRVFLFSHSVDSPINFARYNAVFYLLKKLEKGDRIVIFFSDRRYVYEVTEKVIAESSDTSWLEPKTGIEELVLMTCDPPGTTFRRLLVVARPV